MDINPAVTAGLLNRQATITTMNAVIAERARQDVRWGEQNHPDGTNSDNKEIADAYRDLTEQAAKEGRLTWRHIAQEEFWEALAETDPHRLHAELIQAAAVLTCWAEAIRRRA